VADGVAYENKNLTYVARDTAAEHGVLQLRFARMRATRPTLVESLLFYDSKRRLIATVEDVIDLVADDTLEPTYTVDY
jgi:hypothetical protein